MNAKLTARFHTRPNLLHPYSSSQRLHLQTVPSPRALRLTRLVTGM